MCCTTYMRRVLDVLADCHLKAQYQRHEDSIVCHSRRRCLRHRQQRNVRQHEHHHRAGDRRRLRRLARKHAHLRLLWCAWQIVALCTPEQGRNVARCLPYLSGFLWLVAAIYCLMSSVLRRNSSNGLRWQLRKKTARSYVQVLHSFLLQQVWAAMPPRRTACYCASHLNTIPFELQRARAATAARRTACCATSRRRASTTRAASRCAACTFKGSEHAKTLASAAHSGAVHAAERCGLFCFKHPSELPGARQR